MKLAKNIPHLQINETVLVQCKIVNNDYQQESRIFYVFNRNKLFGQLLDVILMYYKYAMTKLKIEWHLKLKQVLC